MTDNFSILPGCAALAERYDGFLLDLWGTVHDGNRPLPGALDCMAELKRRGKNVLLLSNAPRRSRTVVARLDEIGIPRDLYDEVLTSGEAAHIALRDRGDDWHAGLGRAVYMIGGGGDGSVLGGLE